MKVYKKEFDWKFIRSFGLSGADEETETSFKNYSGKVIEACLNGTDMRRTKIKYLKTYLFHKLLQDSFKEIW